jgi:hypothetical protein
VSGATTTITSGTKSYWFIVAVCADTTIGGFSTYVASGADTMRVGLYRGFVRASGSQTITLVGQSASGAPTNTGLPYLRREITLVAGQSLTFVSGDYITIGFHSQGTTNSFLCSPVLGSGNTDVSYNSISNYVASGFPATLTPTSISSVNLQKPCFELY